MSQPLTASMREVLAALDAGGRVYMPLNAPSGAIGRGVLAEPIVRRPDRGGIGRTSQATLRALVRKGVLRERCEDGRRVWERVTEHSTNQDNEQVSRTN